MLSGALAVPLLATGRARSEEPTADPESTGLEQKVDAALAVDGYGIQGRIGLKNVTLEMSPKPFREMREDYVRAVARVIFRQWEPLTLYADQISILLWTADGSEILEYDGRMETAFPWAENIGESNPGHSLKVENDPHHQALHDHGRLYMAHPPALTYGRLAMIIRVLKSVGREMTGKPIRVGATFDPGGEFARSDFKYKRHNEICLGNSRGKGTFVCCYAVLNGDHHAYAGYPQGIPQGTPFGTFFGRQSQHFLTDLGYDYIWFSNGFGFGLETWMVTGPMFDGTSFHPQALPDLQRKILDFWRDYRKECPRFLIETRGTNLLTGSDLASNGTPLKAIYEGGFNLVTPPNSPWGALNNDFGLELAGYMSRIPELPPGKGFPFRFYTHDPWWLDSPWLDSYVHQPYDIFLPMAVSRITADGAVENANAIEFLTIDNSLGQMPNQVPLEVIPHLLEGLENRPDQPGPLVWVYPFDEYFALAAGPRPRLEEPFFLDWFMRAAINDGLPLNTVVSTRNFLSSVRRRPGLYRESILITRVPDAGTPLAAELLEFSAKGGRLLLYGPLGHAGDDLLAALNLKREQPAAGEFDLELAEVPDHLSGERIPGGSCTGPTSAPVESRPCSTIPATPGRK